MQIKEMKDLEAEIFDVCPNTGMLLFPGEQPLTEEEMGRMFFDSFQNEWDEQMNHYQDELWQESL
jgi:hypothetical protein